ncbi:uncharacterized protein [Choristoneura fumiferana]|uniref:uncharacterized protein n=1 Tax=Choristoneura fumiferana TaxID=7141 RepID=UPI003D15BDDF
MQKNQKYLDESSSDENDDYSVYDSSTEDCYEEILSFDEGIEANTENENKNIINTDTNEDEKQNTEKKSDDTSTKGILNDAKTPHHVNVEKIDHCIPVNNSTAGILSNVENRHFIAMRLGLKV